MNVRAAVAGWVTCAGIAGLALLGCGDESGSSASSTPSGTGGAGAGSGGGGLQGTASTSADSVGAGGISGSSGSGASSGSSVSSGSGATGGSGGSLAGYGCNGSCLFETSFTDAQGWMSDAKQAGAGCGSGFSGIQAGVGNSGAWTTANGSCDEVVTAANYTGGPGGRGFRHYRGDGQNNNGGGINWEWSGNPEAISWCLRMRYESGFHWASDGNPHYTKDLYFNVLADFVIFGHQGGAWGYNVHGATNHPGSLDWVGLMGGADGDGVFHEFAGVIDVPNATLKLWVDDVLVLDDSSVTFGSVTSIGWSGPNNQNPVDNDDDGVAVGDETGAPDRYTDYDDFVVDTNVANGGKLDC